ncbi:hypothetical protein AVEN_47109-1 [Araneus ventricosus]|uniref:Uncharacterized protein n=1 Tax=Araneus ventricosus TaxID=182803 RepID=A0A4Y2LAS7_ARAVE|nr:hypothetical protein AVEN_47109-1 [Araneus ventricosus]
MKRNTLSDLSVTNHSPAREKSRPFRGARYQEMDCSDRWGIEGSRGGETSICALGRSIQSMKKYTRGDVTFAFSVLDEPEHIIARKLLQKVRQVPATLQYPDCMEHKNEESAVFEYFVSINAVQHWSMPAKYFEKSEDMKITFKSGFGWIRVCLSRTTPNPELERSICEDIPSGQTKEFISKRPCKGFTAFTCAPLYFSVIGVNATSERWNDCKDTPENQCRTFDQINFKVTHEGVRCS